MKQLSKDVNVIDLFFPLEAQLQPVAQPEISTKEPLSALALSFEVKGGSWQLPSRTQHFNTEWNSNITGSCSMSNNHKSNCTGLSVLAGRGEHIPSVFHLCSLSRASAWLMKGSAILGDTV